MPLVKGGKIIDDAFVKLADDAALPADGNIMVSADEPDRAERDHRR